MGRPSSLIGLPLAVLRDFLPPSLLRAPVLWPLGLLQVGLMMGTCFTSFWITCFVSLTINQPINRSILHHSSMYVSG